MLSYELAKELKDAGFPQTNGHLIFKSGITLADSGKKWSDNSACLPTLSELIEACGKEFNSLFLLGNGNWVAHDNSEEEPPVYGALPEEAVAKLWLALHGKKAS